MDCCIRRALWSLLTGPIVVFAVCVSVFSPAIPGAYAQAGGSIVGLVTDESGAVVPGVTVTAVSPALQGERVAVTDERGEYRITPLPIGTYRVDYTLSGFRTVREEGIRLTVGFTARMDVVLKLGSMEETITVSGSAAIVDVTSTSASTQLTRETLELTPTSRNGIISLMAQTPAVRSQVDVGGGTVGDPPSFRVYGQDSEPWTTIEGVLTSHTRSGGNYFNYASLEEARVQTISNEAQVASRGVAITMLVKSGGDRIHGDLSSGFLNHKLSSQNIDDGLRAQGIRAGGKLRLQTDTGGDVGGPALPGKLWYYTSARHRTQDLETLGAPPKPNGSPSNTAVFETFLMGKFTYSMNSKNRLIAFAQWDEKYHYTSATQFVAYEARTDRTPPNRKAVSKIEWEAVHTNTLMTSLQFGMWQWSAGQNIQSRTRDSKQTIIRTDADHGGGKPATYDQVTLRTAGTSIQSGNFLQVSRPHPKGTVNWFKSDFLGGNHDFQAGFDYLPGHIYWEFNDRGDVGNYQQVYRSGVPFQINIFNNPARPRNDAHHTAVYAKDNWVIARKLTLNLGVRYARDNAFIPEQCQDAGTFVQAFCAEKIQFPLWNSFSPRMFASYALGDKTVVKGGWARFGRVRNEEEIVPSNPFGATSSTFRWRDLNGNGVYEAGEANLNPNGPDFVDSVSRDTGAQSTTFVSNPGERQPKIDQLALTIERELPSQIAVRVSGIYSRYSGVPRRLNTLRPYDAFSIPITNPDPGPDGRVGTSDDPGRSITYYDFPANLAGRANQRLMVINDPRSTERHRTVELSVNKRFSRRWQLMASYSATKNSTLVPGQSGLVLTSPPNFDPNTEFNTGDNTWEWLGRVSAVYVFPGTVNLSVNFDHRSGTPQARQVLFSGGLQIPTIVLNVDPVGTLRLPNTNVVDLRVGKEFKLPGGKRLSPRLNVYNVTNSNTVVARNLRSGPSYLLPSGILRPRIMELSMAFTY